MTESQKYRALFKEALVNLLNNCRASCEEDEVLVLHIGFDSTNTEISVSLLTDKEPYLEEDEIYPLGEPWPTEAGVDAYIGDNDYRSRGARYAGQGRHKTKPDPLWDKRKVAKKTRCFRPADFGYAQ